MLRSSLCLSVLALAGCAVEASDASPDETREAISCVDSTVSDTWSNSTSPVYSFEQEVLRNGPCASSIDLDHPWYVMPRDSSTYWKGAKITGALSADCTKAIARWSTIGPDYSRVATNCGVGYIEYDPFSCNGGCA